MKNKYTLTIVCEEAEDIFLWGTKIVFEIVKAYWGLHLIQVHNHFHTLNDPDRVTKYLFL